MEGTITSYLNEQRASFSDVPLNDVDSLVLSTIAYLNFEKGSLGKKVPSDITPLPVAVCGIPADDLFGGIWLSRMGGDEFLSTLLASPRFMELDVGFYANEVSSHFEKQFSAITFFLPDDCVYIAFRGTDNSLTGWKEDFNITFMKEVPSQVSARTYLEDVSDMRAKRVYVGGHSKGGNLAEYAASTCRDTTFEKIDLIFNHDGPGFAFEPSDRFNAPEYNAKLRKTVPESSVFGMLMERRSNYRVVRSSGVLFAQHASTHWEVDGCDFVTLDSIRPEAAIVSGTLNSWSESYDPSTREQFIEAVYGIVAAANAGTWGEIAQDTTLNVIAMAEATAKLSPEMRSMLFDMIRDIAPILGSETAKQALNRLGGFERSR